jgi:hypothetical protein
VDHAAASPSCPECGAECPAGAARCGACGFALVDAAEGSRFGGRRSGPTGRRSGRRRSGSARRRSRPSAGLAALAAAGTAVAGVIAIVLATGGGGFPDAPAPMQVVLPDPVPALEAERRLELRFSRAGDGQNATVRCPYPIGPGQMVRCELRYSDGIERAVLVHLLPGGELDATVPYPATLRR